MKESYFQKKIKKEFKKAGFLVFVLSDAFTGGIPDTYVAKDGECAWYELKVNHAKSGQIVHLADDKGEEHGFTREQAIKCYKLKNKGITAQGLVYMVNEDKIIIVEPEDFDKSIPYEEFIKWPELKIKKS